MIKFTGKNISQYIQSDPFVQKYIIIGFFAWHIITFRELLLEPVYHSQRPVALDLTRDYLGLMLKALKNVPRAFVQSM